MKILSGAATDVGNQRENNEDRFLDLPDQAAFVVADGMGGHDFGDAASQAIVDSIHNWFGPNAANPRGTLEGLTEPVPRKMVSFISALTQANEHIWTELSRQGAQTVGSTAVGLVAVSDNLFIANVGDSRAYLIRNGQLAQITEDHSQVQAMVAAGLITSEQAKKHPNRNVITRSVGAQKELEIDIFMLSAENGDRLVLCSDGLTGDLADYELLKICNQRMDAATTARVLVGQAVKNNGHDNVTALVLDISEVVARPPDAQNIPAENDGGEYLASPARFLGSCNWKAAPETEPGARRRSALIQQADRLTERSRLVPHSYLPLIALALMTLIAYFIWLIQNT